MWEEDRPQAELEWQAKQIEICLKFEICHISPSIPRNVCSLLIHWVKYENFSTVFAFCVPKLVAETCPSLDKGGGGNFYCYTVSTLPLAMYLWNAGNKFRKLSLRIYCPHNNIKHRTKWQHMTDKDLH